MSVPADGPLQDTPPNTGHRIIDEALKNLPGVEMLSVSEQLERLATAHEVVSQVLETSRSAGQTPIPGVRSR